MEKEKDRIREKEREKERFKEKQRLLERALKYDSEEERNRKINKEKCNSKNNCVLNYEERKMNWKGGRKWK